MIFSGRVRRGIELGLVILVALMPFHAFLSVWLGSLTGHQSYIQVWKELLLVLMAAGGVYLAIREPELRDRLRTWPILLAGLFSLIALLVTAATRPDFTAVAFGAKTDLEYLVAFALAVMVASQTLIRKLTLAILVSAAIVVGFGTLQAYVLPSDFLTGFGYGPDTVAPYLTLGGQVDNLRFASTLGGPNQLGSYLILPLALCLIFVVRRRQWWWLALLIPGLIVLVHTYSRGAWLGMLAAFGIALLLAIPSRLRLAATGALAAVGVIGAIVLERSIKGVGEFQYFILHSSVEKHNESGSDFEHWASLRHGLSTTLSEPLGHGLGTAGPATLHAGQGLIIENNYLQIAYETGLPGAVVYIMMLAATARELAYRAPRYDLAAACLAALAGISVIALVLPAWADSSTALIFWVAAGAVIGLTPESRHV